MAPSHRRAVLKTIRARLKDEQPCVVVSTSLVEAGVDLDFPAVYRVRAGLDSIIQAAGRRNREGRCHAEKSCVCVFDPVDYSVPSVMRRPEEVARAVAAQYVDIASLDAIRAYFKTLYQVAGDELDEKGVVEAFKSGLRSMSYPFRSVAGMFKLIDDAAYAVTAPDDDDGAKVILNVITNDICIDMMLAMCYIIFTKYAIRSAKSVDNTRIM